MCFRLANSNPQDLEGLLYSACARTRIVVVATGVVPSLVYHIISTTNILSFNVTRTPTDPLSISNSTSIDHKAQIARANAALYKAKESARKINRNVDRPTQDLFGAIDKQFSARWQGMDIVVMERVVVKSPGYSTEDCKVITKDGEGLLARVRKVVSDRFSTYQQMRYLIGIGLARARKKESGAARRLEAREAGSAQHNACGSSQSQRWLRKLHLKAECSYRQPKQSHGHISDDFFAILAPF